MIYKLIIISYLFFSNIINSYANFSIIEPIQMAHDSRIATYVYKPDSMYKYIGFQDFQSHIRLEPGESVATISMGNSTGWEIVPSGNRIFLRPKHANAQTNMTLITNKRLYQFDLDVGVAKSLYDENLIIEARFIYPSEDDNIELINYTSYEGPDLSKPELYNFNYSFTGPDNIAPIKVFDDGEFTFFEFSVDNNNIPAIFYVDNDGYEGLVNYRAEGNYIIVERLSSVFTLRNGTDTICVFNENRR